MKIKIDFDTSYIPVINKTLKTKGLSKRLRFVLNDLMDSVNRELDIQKNENRTISDVIRTLNADQMLALEALLGFAYTSIDLVERSDREN